LYGAELKKDKRIHIRGWKPPLPQGHLDYAIADAVWTYKIGKEIDKLNEISNELSEASVEKKSEDIANECAS
jgi:hypothetical protein